MDCVSVSSEEADEFRWSGDFEAALAEDIFVLHSSCFELHGMVVRASVLLSTPPTSTVEMKLLKDAVCAR